MRLIRNTRRFILVVILFTLCYLPFVKAQSPVTDGLVSYFPFDSTVTEASGSLNKAFFTGDTTLYCGVTGRGIRLDGIVSEVDFIGAAYNENFKIGDFSFSFYFKANAQSGNATFDIFSKRRSCTRDSTFAIRYTPSTNIMSVEMTQNATIGYSMTQRLDFNRCWQHIVIVRNYTQLRLYVNGRLAQVANTTKRVNITNDQPLRIAGSPCLSTTDRKFSGYIDDIRLYDHALTDADVQTLYFSPDKLATRDTIIFLGSSVPLRTTQTCSKDFTWSPKEIMSDPKATNPIALPTQGGNYKITVVMKETQCTAVDTINVKVIDPKDLDCKKAFLPNAFTPNGDNRNDKFYISNPYAIDEVKIFEIFDAWGGRIFSTTDKFEGWDGNVNGVPINPGVFLWKVKYICKGQELQEFGSVTLLR